MRCPYCGCEGMIKNGHTAIGTQRYTCKYCGKRSAADRTVIRLKHIKHNIFCPVCGSNDLKKSGKSHKDCNSGDRYTCHLCGKKFTVLPKLTEKQKKLIDFYHNGCGITATDLAKHLKISRVAVLEYIRQYRTKSEEQNGESANINARRIS